MRAALRQKGQATQLAQEKHFAAQAQSAKDGATSCRQGDGECWRTARHQETTSSSFLLSLCSTSTLVSSENGGNMAPGIFTSLKTKGTNKNRAQGKGSTAKTEDGGSEKTCWR